MSATQLEVLSEYGVVVMRITVCGIDGAGNQFVVRESALIRCCKQMKQGTSPVDT
jgi:hypothetical protein